MASQDGFRLLHVTDPHLYADSTRTLYGVNTSLSFRRVLQQASADHAQRPDAILATGDIADDHSAGAYQIFREALQGYGVPVLCLPGNHDEPALMARELDDDGFQYCGRAEFGDWGLVLLDTHLPGNPAGELSGAELDRLDAELRACAERPVLVCLHHPPVEVGSAWLDGVGLRNAKAFLDVIDRFPNVKATLAGHVHQAFDRPRGRVRMLTSPSTCAQFTPGTARCVMDMRPPGYRWLHLLPDGAVQTEVVWLRDWLSHERPIDDRS